MLIVFSDLDGTILDLKDYSWSRAMEGISLLKERGVPLVAASGKTKDEIGAVAEEVGLAYPYIFENGAGVAWGPGEGEVTLLTPPLHEFMEALARLSEISGKKLTGISSMSIEEIVSHTGLSSHRALLASKRSGSMPFLINGEKTVDSSEAADLNSFMEGLGFRVIKGGKFYHLLPAGIDKGAGVRRVIQYFQEATGSLPFTASIGDGENDIPMFAETDLAVAVSPIDSALCRALKQSLLFTREEGPAGFTSGVRLILKQYYGME